MPPDSSSPEQPDTPEQDALVPALVPVSVAIAIAFARVAGGVLRIPVEEIGKPALVNISTMQDKDTGQRYFTFRLGDATKKRDTIVKASAGVLDALGKPMPRKS